MKKMPPEEFKSGMHTAWSRTLPDISDFIDSYPSMDEKKRKKSYEDLSKDLGEFIGGIHNLSPFPNEMYRPIGQNLERSKLKNEERAVHDLAYGLLMAAASIEGWDRKALESQTKLSILLISVKSKGTFDSLRPMIDYVQKMLKPEG